MGCKENTANYRSRRLAEIAQMAPIPCECECGTLIPPLTKQFKPARFALGHNSRTPEARQRASAAQSIRTLAASTREKIGDAHRGARNARWCGGAWKVKGGYYRRGLTAKEAAKMPTATKHGKGWSIPRSHYVWNLAHPDDLVTKSDHVHHLNGRRDDDRAENLVKMDGEQHLKMHWRTTRRSQNAP